MRVLTLNLWGRQGDWEARRTVLREGLARLHPELVAFQETVVVDGYDQVADLLGPAYTVMHLPGRSADGVGSSVASRWPPGVLRTLALPRSERMCGTPGWIGSVTAVEVGAPEPIGTVLLVHHKPAWQWGFEAEREAQAVAAARFVEGWQGGGHRHVVLVGDLDARPESASVRFWAGLQALDGFSVRYEDAWASVHPEEAGHTFTPENPLVRGGEMPLERGRRIDYVFVRCGDHGPSLRVTRCERVFAEPTDGVWASDHFGVVADFDVMG